MVPSYESFFGLSERPFSLTPDPAYFYKSRAHGRAVEAITFGLRARERVLLVTGDLGVGKTVLCRTLLEHLRRRGLVTYVASPLMTADAFSRLVLDDLEAGARAADSSHRTNAVVIVDEAHTVPAALVEHLLSFSRLDACSECAFQFVFVGQSTPGDAARLGIHEIDDVVTTRVRVLPLSREECVAYVAHRLSVAGAHHAVEFAPRTLDYVFSLSGGVPRLVNLLCERALQEAAAVGTRKIEPATIDLAAAALQLLRARPRRFRWYTRRAS
jgi:general secretion pathway protein A